ncbi:MAG TPA: outer membrane protein assembly factor BamD, partial [Candidatus Nanopelagicales bacterium]|nr:outer membrane protein assembly factor BamD [Candidatus Nanopelagicales bacterium]
GANAGAGNALPAAGAEAGAREGAGEAAGAAPAAAERASRLREESRVLGEARDALRRGDAAGALQKLEEVRTRFPDGVLTQEREALAIEALYRSGSRAAASARAAAFLRAWPTSPHATRIQGFVQ